MNKLTTSECGGGRDLKRFGDSLCVNVIGRSKHIFE